MGKWLRPILLFFLLGAASVLVAQGASPSVDVLRLQGVINPVTAGYVMRGIQTAEADGAKVLVIQMDTPGGLDSSMREIVQGILNARLPVVVYVFPQGGRSASAGVFITLAAHVAAMAPNTNIGAAHPVAIGGGIPGTEQQPDKTMIEKATNDAVAYIKSLAAQRGRNAQWAESAVRESVSVTEREALDLKIIDVVANDLPSLLAQIHGRQVSLATGSAILDTRDAQVRYIDMTISERFLFTISDPNIAFILLSLAMTALIFEFSNPGAILPGVVGGIALLLALFSLGMFPVNYTGVGLIILAFILFLMEVKIPSYGLLTVGGIISMSLGALMLVGSSAPFLSVSRPLIAGVVLGTTGVFVVVVGAVARAHRRKVTTGWEGLIGQVGVARSTLSPEGVVLVEGERWAAIAEEGAVLEGERVVVIDKEGFRLRVRKI